MVVTNSEKIPIGWQAPDFELSDTNHQSYSLSDFDKPVLVIIFTCNHCPYAQASWPILVDLSKKYKDQVQFVAINANDDSQYHQDSVEGMEKLVKENQVSFPYLRDETQEVAKKYQALCTPDVFVFKNHGQTDFKLDYHGRINDNWQHPELVTEHSLDEAIDRCLNELDPILDQHPSIGCSIKWRD